MTRNLKISHRGLSRLGHDLDFELKTDNDLYTIRCSKSQISFISPIISNILLSDPTIKEFKLETPNSEKYCEYLRSFICGGSVDIPQDLVDTFYSISLELRSEELLTCVNITLTHDNVFEIMKNKYNLSYDIEREISFIASNFNELSETISNLELHFIEGILGSKSLVILNEHSLFEFICGLISSFGDDYRYLLSFLHMEYLDADDVSAILSYIDDTNIGHFLQSLFRRLLYQIPYVIDKKEDKDRHTENVKEFNYKDSRYNGDKFNGILSSLWKSSLDSCFTIEETTNNCRSNVYALVDPKKRNDSIWPCETTEGGSFLIDFKEAKVALNGYSFMAHSKSMHCTGFIKSWKIEGSNNKTTWYLVDKKDNSEALLSLSAQGFWPCNQSHPFRYFRIMMTDKNTNGNYIMALNAIEFFGKILSSSE